MSRQHAPCNPKTLSRVLVAVLGLWPACASALAPPCYNDNIEHSQGLAYGLPETVDGPSSAAACQTACLGMFPERPGFVATHHDAFSLIVLCSVSRCALFLTVEDE